MFISDTKRGRLLKSVLALAIPLIFCFAVIVPAHEISSSQGKYVDEGRAEMTAWAAENLEENAQLAAWWDYNYYYQFETGLKTIGDGGLIKDEWMYWLGKAFAIDDCEKSAYLFKVLGAKGLDDRALLEEIATCETLDTEKIEKAIGSENRPTYVMLGSDMVNKAGVMGYYGLWDGSGSEPVLGVSNTSTEVDYGEEAYVDIAGIEDCKAHYERSENGAITVTIEKGEGGHYDIGRCIYMEDGNVISDATDESKAADMALTLYLMNHNNEISVVVCSPELADSTVLRLALRNGRGQNVFVPVFGNGNTIWRINI